MKRVKAVAKRAILHYRGLSNQQKALVWLIVFGIGLIIVPSAVGREVRRNRSAKMYFTTASSKVNVGETFPLELRVQTGGQSINAVGSLTRFNPTYLEVVSMTTDKSFCSFYLDNTFDNIKGEVKVTCGNPNPGFSGDSVVVRLNMRAKIVGTTALSVDAESTNALANDGKGTNILRELPDYHLDITQHY